jgi:hypothetical protein
MGDIKHLGMKPLLDVGDVGQLGLPMSANRNSSMVLLLRINLIKNQL